MPSDSEVSYVSGIKKRPSRKRLPYISKTRPIPLQLLILFVAVKVSLFCLIHVTLWSVPANNVAGDLILKMGHSETDLDEKIKRFLLPLIRWDAVHFFAIAQKGYLFENQFAFFPLLPFLSRWLGKLITAISSGHLSIESGIGMAGVLISNVAHYLASLVLYHLTLFLFKSSTFAFTSAVLFICNPACIQLSTFYSESLFAFLCFSGLFVFYHRLRLLAAILFGLASLTRSNGIVMVGFFWSEFLKFSFGQQGPFTGIYWISQLFKTVLYSLISVSGFLGFQAFAYSQFCLQSDSRPWCQGALPTIYGFVQQHYWGVGLFRYFTVAQIPNFLFALPMLTICSCAAFVYVEFDHRRFLSFGLSRSSQRRARKLDLFLSDSVLDHIYLLLFMLLYNFFVAHVQIITRLFTFMPVVYWFMAYVMLTASVRTQWNLQAYVALYGLIGASLFSLNLPPA